MGTIDLHARRDFAKLYFDGERISPHMLVAQPEPSDAARESLATLVDTGTVAIAIHRPTPPMFCVTDNGELLQYSDTAGDSVETTDTQV